MQVQCGGHEIEVIPVRQQQWPSVPLSAAAPAAPDTSHGARERERERERERGGGGEGGRDGREKWRKGEKEGEEGSHIFMSMGPTIFLLVLSALEDVCSAQTQPPGGVQGNKLPSTYM